MIPEDVKIPFMAACRLLLTVVALACLYGLYQLVDWLNGFDTDIVVYGAFVAVALVTLSLAAVGLYSDHRNSRARKAEIRARNAMHHKGMGG